MAGSDLALTAVSRRARLTRSRVAAAAAPATITMKATRSPNASGKRCAWWCSGPWTPGRKVRRRSSRMATNGMAISQSFPTIFR
jgi:hypothetical protein